MFLSVKNQSMDNLIVDVEMLLNFEVMLGKLNLQKEESLEREKKVRADVEKAKRKVEADLKQTQEAVEELDRIKHELEDNVRRFVQL